MIKPDKLDFWIEHGYNVLLVGAHGVGKSAIVKEAFERNGLKWKYFSAATMDPWCDFIGIPKEHKNEDGTSYLDLIRPKEFQDDAVEAIFMDEFNRCLVGSTLISLASGEDVEIQELVGRSHFYVYSYDLENKKIQIGKGHSARRTGIKQKVLRITLDNGKFIICTPNHPFLLRDGTYCNAEDLKLEDSLMPLYKRLSDEKKLSLSGYEQVYQPILHNWDFTHRLADEYNIKDNVYSVLCGKVRHHKDYNKLNNSPENIVRLGWSQHLAVHKNTGSNGGKQVHKIYPDLYLRTIGNLESRVKALTNSISTRHSSVVYKKLRSEISNNYWTSETKLEQKMRCSNQWESGSFDKINRWNAAKLAKRTAAIKFAKSIIDLTPDKYEAERRLIKGRGNGPVSLPKLIELFDKWDNFEEAVRNNNHSVVSIEDGGFEDVYDITVDNFHNFALSSGVIVHNSHKKVRNAVMELIQFKSINGKEFKNLKIIWAAINPDDEEKYDVERLDPAQEDRFQIKVTVPYLPDSAYFTTKYGEDMSKAAISWWNELPQEQKEFVSPRRLDYALDVISNNGDARDVLPTKTNVSKLLASMRTGPTTEKLLEFRQKLDVAGATAFLAVENNFRACKNHIVNNNDSMTFFLPCLPDEKIVIMVGQEQKVLASVVSRVNQYPNFKKVIHNMIVANVNKRVVKKILDYAKTQRITGVTASGILGVPVPSVPVGSRTPTGAPAPASTVDKPYMSTNTNTGNLSFTLKNAQSSAASFNANTNYRLNVYNDIENYIPKILPTDVAITTLEWLGNVASKSQFGTLKRLKNFVGLVNHCLDQIYKNENITDWNAFTRASKYKMNDLFKNCRNVENFRNRVLKP